MRNYRGKALGNKKWYFGSCVKIGDRYFIVNPDAGFFLCNCGTSHFAGYVEVIPSTVGQGTGLCDKNGKDLDWYAGDIIQKGEIILPITVDWEHGMRFMLGKHTLCKQDGVHGVKIGTIHDEAKE